MVLLPAGDHRPAEFFAVQVLGGCADSGVAMRPGFLIAIAITAGASRPAFVSADERPLPFRHSYCLFATSQDDTQSAGYLLMLVTRVPIEAGGHPEVAVLMTYERNALWQLESKSEKLEDRAVNPAKRTVRFRGKAHRYQQVPNAETIHLLEHPEGTLPLHRTDPPIGREAGGLRDELLRDLAAADETVGDIGPGEPSISLQAGGGEADLIAKLEAVSDPPWTETAARIRFTVENRGEKPHRVLRLRSGWLEYNGGNLHGWMISIEGPGGDYRLPEYSGLVPPPEEKDYIELVPGESYSTIIRLDEAARWENEVRHPLPSTPGTYKVSIPGDVKIEHLNFTVGGP